MPRFRIADVAPPSETVTRTLTILGADADVTYYRNRITLERDIQRPKTDDDDDEDKPDEEARTARDLCYIVKSWDLVGPVEARDGTLLVEDDAPIPLDPAIVAAIPLRVTNAITTALIEAEFPPQRSGRTSRRR